MHLEHSSAEEYWTVVRINQYKQYFYLILNNNNKNNDKRKFLSKLTEWIRTSEELFISSLIWGRLEIW